MAPRFVFLSTRASVFRNFMNHQRILPLPTSINIYIISVSFVFCHCPQALHFSNSDQFAFRFRVSRIYWRRGRARPEFWRIQLRGKECIFIRPNQCFYIAHKRSFLFLRKCDFVSAQMNFISGSLFQNFFLRFQFNTAHRTSFSTFSIFGFRFRVNRIYWISGNPLWVLTGTVKREEAPFRFVEGYN